LLPKYIVLLPGDGIGREIMDAAKIVLQSVATEYGHHFKFYEHEIGGEAIDQYGHPLPEETVQACQSADAVLLGAVGGEKWDNQPAHLRPEQGLLGIRKTLGVFANLRPIKSFSPLLHASPLKESVVKDSDILIVRELTSGLYFGEPSKRGNYGKSAIDTMYYHTDEIERIVEYAFQSAQMRNKLVTSVDKANVLETSRLWREIVHDVSKRYPEVMVEHLLVDAAAMKLMTNPNRFDVLVTENLFGDILSDEASILTGALGMLPSASLRADGVGLYEPVHGSAPDIAGEGIANPLGMILSVALMLRHSFHLHNEAKAIENAVYECLNQGYHTPDLNVKGGTEIGTLELTDIIVEQISAKSISNSILEMYA